MRNKNILSGVFLGNLLFCVSIFASVPVPDAARPGFDTIDPESMKAILTFLAADELEGRDTGHRGLDIAAKFLESQYRLIGLTPAPGQSSMLQSFLIRESRLDTLTNLAIVGPRKKSSAPYALFKDFVALAHLSGDRLIEAPVVFAGFGFTSEEEGYNDFKGLKTAGKILLVFSGTPQFSDSAGIKQFSIAPATFREGRNKAAIAKDAGAAALVIVNDRFLSRNEALTRRWLNRTSVKLVDDSDDLPLLYVTTRLADSLLESNGWTCERLRAKILAKQSSQSFELKKTHLAIDLKVHAETKSTQNVVAYLEGCDPVLKEEVVAFGAHYDHVGVDGSGDVFNGADDDGSGTTGMLEIARAFAKNFERPRRSLLFVSHTGEEKGLLGSRYYTDHPLVPLTNTVAQLNMDMIGRNDSNSVYIIGSDFLSSELHQVSLAANAIVGMNFDYTFNDKTDPNRFYYRSDHYNYARHGIPIVFYFSGVHEDYHKVTDTVDKINFDKMARIARLVYLTGWNVANREARPKVDHNFTDEP
ncbi:MAG TPA: M28 family peptidase [bacterium]